MPVYANQIFDMNAAVANESLEMSGRSNGGRNSLEQINVAKRTAADAGRRRLILRA
ncbi:hypothetical protein D9M72_584440 [compost metagenome]